MTTHAEEAWQWGDAVFADVSPMMEHGGINAANVQLGPGRMVVRPLRTIDGVSYPVTTVSTRTEDGHLCVMEGIGRAWAVRHCEAVWAERLWVCGFLPDHDGPHLASTYELIEGQGVRIIQVSTKRSVESGL